MLLTIGQMRNPSAEDAKLRRTGGSVLRLSSSALSKTSVAWIQGPYIF